MTIYFIAGLFEPLIFPETEFNVFPSSISEGNDGNLVVGGTAFPVGSKGDILATGDTTSGIAKRVLVLRTDTDGNVTAP